MTLGFRRPAEVFGKCSHVALEQSRIRSLTPSRGNLDEVKGRRKIVETQLVRAKE